MDDGSEATTAIGLLRGCVAECPDRPFLDFSGETHTYAEVWEASQRLARGLRKAGVERGDTVAAMLDNGIDGVASWFGANLLGAVWVGVNTALKGDFLRHVVEDSGARVALCEPDFVERFGRIDDEVRGLDLLLHRGTADDTTWARFGVDALDAYRLDGDDEAWGEPRAEDVSLLVYTGGTTGPSKGCAISYGYSVNGARAFLAQTRRPADEVNWSPLPMFHLNVLNNTVVGTMVLRGRASIAPRFSVSGFWPEIERTGAGLVNLLGSMSSMLARMPDTPEMARCRGRIRMLHAVPVPPDVEAVWNERFGVPVAGIRSYGMTEAFPITTLEPGEDCPPGTSGRCDDRYFEVRVVDDCDRPVPPGDVGEIVCRPSRPNGMFQGYWRRPEATLAATRNLWFHTGDLGKLDREGYLTFVDRKKDYLRRRGENISSQEMEAVFLTHPDIAEVAVHAVPSDVTEDDVKVTAVLVDGSGLTPAVLFEWAKARVPYFALPRYVEFRDALPASALGRVHKYKLRDEGPTPATWDRDRAGVTWDRR